jgi:heavy metal translocating P-type ATPase
LSDPPVGTLLTLPDSTPSDAESTPSRSEIQRPTSNTRTPNYKLQTTNQCELCGLPVGRSGAETLIDHTLMRFCCAGCMAVFQVLFNAPGGTPGDFKETELYRACVASGIIPETERTTDPGAEAASGLNTAASLPSSEEDHLAEELVVRIDGMWCTACAWLIEAVLGNMRGILSTEVLFFADIATIRYLPHRISPRDILKAISRMGYHAALPEDLDGAQKEKKRLLLGLGISSILTVNIMMISFALYGGFFRDLGEDAIRYFSYPLLILATPVVFYGGFPIIKRAWLGLRFRNLSMDTLITVGTLSAYFYSLAMMTKGSLHLYFDTAAMLVTLVLLGKYVEQEARDKASGGVRELCGPATGKVRLLRDKSESWISSETVKPGDEFLVADGERIPLDGTVMSGHANLDESILTGESRPVRKSSGNEVLAGSLVLDGQLLLRATRTAAHSSIGQMISLMHHAIANKSPIELLADRITRWLVPAILFLATGTVLYLSLHETPLDDALLRGLTVLLITCPCALGIATPLAKVAAIGASRTNGIVIQNSEAFEKTRNLDTFLFDKTGTITEGRFTLAEVFSDGIGREEALRRVASMETFSEHFLAKEIVRAAKDLCLALEEPSSFEFYEGLGIRGMLKSGDVCAGNRRLMEAQGLLLASAMDERAGLEEAGGRTVVFFGWDEEVKGFLTFGDSPRTHAGQIVSGFQAEGREVWLVSGDSLTTTRSVAYELGIKNFVGEALPKDKMSLVLKLQENGRRVGMVGDGINDALALTQADAGIAFGSAANLVRHACDITILDKDLKKIPAMLRLSTLTSKIIRENLLFAFLYNFLGIPLAMVGVLNPLIAVLAMFASSLTVIGNTLRIPKQNLFGP